MVRSTGSIRVAAECGALVWAIYGVAETLAIVAAPVVRDLLSLALPGSVPRLAGHSFVSAPLTAVLLVAYPLIGAMLSAGVAVVVGRVGQSPWREVWPPDARSLQVWSGVAVVTASLALALSSMDAGYGSVARAAVVPTVVGGLLIRGRWARPQSDTDRGQARVWAGPVAAITALVLGAVIAQPRPWLAGRNQLLLEIACVTLVLGAGAAIARVRPTPWFTHWTALGAYRAVVGVPLLLSLAGALWLPNRRPTELVVREPAPHRPGDNRPSVVLITLDTVRADRLSVYGYARDTTPSLRRWATDATVYRDALSSSNWTLPTHGSLFTGQQPWRHGARSSPDGGPSAIVASTQTLAEVLAAAGYRTAGFAANSAFLTPAFGFDRGFSHYFTPTVEDFFTPLHRRYLIREAIRRRLTPPRRPRFVDAAQINRRTAEFLESARSSRQPVFLFLNYMDAHDPYLPPQPFSDLFPGRDDSFNWDQFGRLVQEVGVERQRSLSDREAQHLQSQYDGALAYLDHELSSLFQTLRRFGLNENSLIIVTSDHGEALGEHGRLGHGTSLHQPQIHVPLLIKFPDARRGAVVDTPASSVDILPTVLDVVGLPVPPGVDGASLVPTEHAATRWRASEWGASPVAGTQGTDPDVLAVFRGPLKEVVTYRGGNRLHDLSGDPAESRDLASTRVLPEGWHSKRAEYLEEIRSSPVRGLSVDRETLERLRSLGYLR